MPCHVDEDENHGVVILVMLLRGIIGAAVEKQKLDDPGNGRRVWNKKLVITVERPDGNNLEAAVC